jgi:hypothetical protein
MNWTMAHRTASIAAANLLCRLDMPEDAYVDVFEALRRTGLGVMGKDLPSLFGMYVPAQPGSHPGILLNSIMGEATIRHTAGHELGHAEFGHQRCLADGPDPFSTTPPEKWPDQEKQAEAFAAWFLMPIRLVKTTLLRLGLDVPREAADAYQLSLHLGASYRGTVRHLKNLRMVDGRTAAGWRTVQPARLRARLSGQPEATPSRVWDLGSLTEGGSLAVAQGDRLIVRAPWLGDDPTFTGPDGVEMLATPRALSSGEGAEFDVCGPIGTATPLTLAARAGGERWSVTLLPTPEEHQGLLARPRSRVLVGPAKGATR